MHTAVTVVIPLRNEESSVGALLDALQAQTFAPAEIVCVDGGSTDATCELIRGRDWGPVAVRLIESGPALPGRGRNLGTRHASHEWIAYIDGGIVPDANWLQELVAVRDERADVEAIFGNYTPRTETFFTKCAAIAYVRPLVLEDGQKFRGPVVPSSLIRRSLWKRIGEFREDLRSGEDVLFIASARDTAMCAYAPQANVTWELAPSWSRTVARFRAYSKSGIEAGAFNDWHWPVLTRYAAVGAIAVAAVALGKSWLWGLVLLAAFLMLRSFSSMWRHRLEIPRAPWSLAACSLGVTAVITAADVGLFWGTLDWLTSRRWGGHGDNGASPEATESNS